MANFKLPYHRSHVQLEIPDRFIAGCLESGVNTYRSDMTESSIVQQALDNPIGSPTLESLVKNKNRITILTSDHTRPLPSWQTMPILLKRIRESEPGIRIAILIATGFHRKTTLQESLTMFGKDIVIHENIIVHNSNLDSDMVQIGSLPSGGELWVNRLAVETDLLIAEGFIEPHFFAGFSGGRKSVLPGVAGYKTVLANHCSEFIAHDKARTGILNQNPIHEDMMFAARKAGLKFILNVILNDKKEIIHAVAGDMEKAHLQGCDFLNGLCQVNRTPADIVITTNGGYPLDQNVYQAVKGMTAAEATLKKDGIIIMVAACEEGHGSESFYKNLSEAANPGEILEQTLQVPREKTRPDQWEYQILARILNKFRVILVTDMCDPEIIKAMHMDHAPDINTALEMARAIKGKNSKITVIPDGVGVIVKN